VGKNANLVVNTYSYIKCVRVQACCAHCLVESAGRKRERFSNVIYELLKPCLPGGDKMPRRVPRIAFTRARRNHVIAFPRVSTARCARTCLGTVAYENGSATSSTITTNASVSTRCVKTFGHNEIVFTSSRPPFSRA